jgi:hypothetical protein
MNTRRRTPAALALATSLGIAACGGGPGAGPAPGPGAGETIVEPLQPVFQAAAPTHGIGGASEQQLAQTFTLVHAGTLVGVFLPLGCASGELEIEVRDLAGDEPGTTVLSSGSYPAAAFVTGVPVFKLFRLPALPVSAGDRLALVLRNPTGSCGMATAPEGDPYPAGEAFFDARPNAPGWQRLFGSDVLDLAFQVMLEVS